jgi:hypothetical protein
MFFICFSLTMLAFQICFEMLAPVLHSRKKNQLGICVSVTVPLWSSGPCSRNILRICLASSRRSASTYSSHTRDRLVKMCASS